MKTFRDVIDEWPSLQAFADDLGVKYVTAQLMRHRDSIAAKHWKRAVGGASRRRIDGISLEVLAAIEEHKGKAPPRRSRPLESRVA